MPSGLFGIEHSNRSDTQHWTKNCFNSSFPTSLACYMMEHDIPAIYAKLAMVNGQLKVVCEELPIQELFHCGTKQTNALYFEFESRFEPYQKFSLDSIDAIDLVVRDLNGNYLAPVEIKLTVLPTSATAKKPEKEWGCELVVRTATTSYCVFSIWDKIKDKHSQVREIFEDTCSDIGSWTNDFEMSHKTESLRSNLDLFEREFLEYQCPLVMQPFWKTQGQNPVLCDRAFDIVVWSNFAFSRLYIETSNDSTMSRPMRASARMARCLWELGKSGKIRVEEIYRQMAFGQQTDKEVAVPGDRWRRYVTSDRVLTPAVSKDSLFEILSSDYVENLRPERRFDQTLYYTQATRKP